MTTQDEKSEQLSDAPEPEPETGTAGAPPASRPKEEAAPPRESSRSGGKILFILALLPGLLVLGWLAWNHLQPGTEFAEQAALDERFESLAEQLDDHGRQLSVVSSMAEALGARVDGIDIAPLQREIDAYRNDLGELERRLEGRLRAMDTRLDEADLYAPDTERRIPLLEVAALLRLGADRLELAADADGARRAFERARQRLNLSDDPRVGAVDRQIAREIDAIAAWGQPDWAGISGHLRALSESVSDWPIKPVTPVLDTDPEERRSWRGRMQRTLSSLITIRRKDETELTPIEADQLRSGLQARLAASELEAVRRDAAALALVLAPVEEALDRFFDADHPRVQAARQSVSEVLEVAETPESDSPPALGEAARQLQSLLERE